MELINEAVNAGARLREACRLLGLSIRTYERWKTQSGGEDRRAGPKTEPPNKLTKAERKKLLEVVNRPEFCDLPPSQIVPRLAERGEYYASETTMYRVLREEKQLAHRGRTKEPQERIPVVRIATRPNQIWSWDITYLRGPARGMFFYLYMVMDIWSRKIVGWAVHEVESADLAANLIREAAATEHVEVDKLTLHSDNGGPMKGSTMLATLQSLGIAASFTRPRTSDDNPFSESLFKTLKYRPWYPKDRFSSLEEARSWVAAFVRWYHEEHRHSGIKFVRPIERHDGLDIEILARRHAAYEAAKARHPNRWGSRPTRNWTPPKRVCVRARPDRKMEEEVATKNAALAAA